MKTFNLAIFRHLLVTLECKLENKLLSFTPVPGIAKAAEFKTIS
jgi:hypothetical protein